MRWMSRVVWLLAVLLLAAVSGRQLANARQETDKIEPQILEQINQTGEADFWLLLDQKADLSQAPQIDDWNARGQFVYDQLRATADASQAGLRDLLDRRGVTYQSYWIANAILVQGGSRALLDELARRPEVAQILAPAIYQIPEPQPGIVEPPINAVEWGIADINADDVWSTYGVRGEGIVVANIDTGVQYNHPAVDDQYRGNLGGGVFDHNYNWFDPSNVCGNPSLVPCDNNDHGTHTMGTMVGDDGGSNQIGVAPAARWIAAKGCESNTCSRSALLASAQWIMAPTDLNDQNPRPDLRPHVVNNSWGGPSGDPWYQAMVDGWVASGIFPAFSNGNSGAFGCSSSGSPGDYLNSYSAGAYNSSHAIAGFSSRGPSDFANEIKPNIAAPGVNVRSSVPTNSYASFQGTSMASPHVAGTVALMWSASPAVVGDITIARQSIDVTAVDTSSLTCGGTAADNNVWGEGRLDALAAVEEALEQGGPFFLEATPAQQSACVPQAADYDIVVKFFQGFSDPVTLSAGGVPTGYQASFNPNPVAPPGISTMSLGNVGAAAPGSYTIDVVGAVPTYTFTTTVGFDLFDVPPAPVLISPADGASGVNEQPTLEWSAAFQAESYLVEVATDAAFSDIVYSAAVSGTSHTLTAFLAPLTTYHWRVRAANFCGSGVYSDAFTFTTRDIPLVMLVDDDDNSPDVRSTYTDALEAMGLSYDVWDTANSDSEPSAAQLALYRAVIWFSGDEFGGGAGPGAAGEAALAAWLDGDGCLFISSQDYLYDKGHTPFMSSHLGLASFTLDVNHSQVEGQAIYRNMGPYTLAYPFFNFSDLLTPGAAARTVWLGDEGSAAIAKKTDAYTTVWLGFPMEALPDATVRTLTLRRFALACQFSPELGVE